MRHEERESIDGVAAREGSCSGELACKLVGQMLQPHGGPVNDMGNARWSVVIFDPGEEVLLLQMRVTGLE